MLKIYDALFQRSLNSVKSAYLPIQISVLASSLLQWQKRKDARAMLYRLSSYSSMSDLWSKIFVALLAHWQVWSVPMRRWRSPCSSLGRVQSRTTCAHQVRNLAAESFERSTKHPRHFESYCLSGISYSMFSGVRKKPGLVARGPAEAS